MSAWLTSACATRLLGATTVASAVLELTLLPRLTLQA